MGYFKTPGYFLKRVTPFLKPGGLIIFTIVNTSHIKSILTRLLKKNTYYSGYSSYSEYCKILKEKSYKIVDSKGIGWLPFGVNSNSLFIPYFIILINMLRLNKIPSLSPESILSVKKQ